MQVSVLGVKTMDLFPGMTHGKRSFHYVAPFHGNTLPNTYKEQNTLRFYLTGLQNVIVVFVFSVIFLICKLFYSCSVIHTVCSYQYVIFLNRMFMDVHYPPFAFLFMAFSLRLII